MSELNSLFDSPDLTAYNRDERDVAKFLKIGVETVRSWRKRQCGPQFRKINGKLVRYSVRDLQAWIESQPTGGGK